MFHGESRERWRKRPPTRTDCALSLLPALSLLAVLSIAAVPLGSRAEPGGIVRSVDTEPAPGIRPETASQPESGERPEAAASGNGARPTSATLRLAAATAHDGNRLCYLDVVDPYFPTLETPRLTTPQWVGEPGVEAVVTLGIDDLRDTARYEAFLRPILNRLLEIEHRAAVSIMTCHVDPADPQLARWLAEGVSLECHTVDHPCPLLAEGDFKKAKNTYDRCIDLLASVPGNRPVAFRMPCCDSLNTNSPRFYAEIFSGTSPQGRFLQLTSSVMNILTSRDPALPRELVRDADGSERFLKYVPQSSFVGTIENYPYPYVVGDRCWEFPATVPSDWQAQHLHRPLNPRTVEDWQAALDAIVVKRGVMNLVFHPHGWIRSEQVVELIDHARQQHAGRVRFLTFAEVLERLNRYLLAGEPLRAADGSDNGVRLIDLDGDGYLDVLIANERVRRTRLWSPAEERWIDGDCPFALVTTDEDGQRRSTGARFGVLDDRAASVLLTDERALSCWHFRDGHWVPAPERTAGLEIDGQPLVTARAGRDRGLRLVDLDGDGRSEVLVANDDEQAVFGWSTAEARWQPLPLAIPAAARFVGAAGGDGGLRLVDLDDDGALDLVYSNESHSGVALFVPGEGWSRELLATSGRDEGALPLIARQGTHNGAWFHSRHLWVQNEDTSRQRDLVERRSFDELLAGAVPAPLSPLDSWRTLHPRPGMQIELVAHEPLVADPVAFDWGPDGRLWVAEMTDYPEGDPTTDPPGGRVRVLEDTTGDGRYDRAEVFLSGLSYPTSVLAWRDGVLVMAAPDIIYAEDRDGDGRADHQEVLFTGMVPGNPQHRANGLVRGLDNWLYCANGDSGGRVRALASGQEVQLGGRDFRIRPAEGRVELVSGTTQFIRSTDDWGNWFGNNNANPMWLYVFEDRYLERNGYVSFPSGRVDVPQMPGAAPVFPRSRLLARFNDLHMANHFTSCASAIVYRDELLGPEFVGNLFVSEPVHNLVHRQVMHREGVLFRSRRAPDETRAEFLAATDNCFRPTMIRTGLDGALWVADMYRLVIEHPEWIPESMLAEYDVRAGAGWGRIYRVWPVGAEPRSVPRFDRLDVAGLVAVLESPNGPQRDLAQALLIERGDAAAIPLLVALVRNGNRPTARLHALCTLDGLGALAEELLLAALADVHPGVRRHAVRLAETLVVADTPLEAALVALVDDPDPQVRMQLAYTLGEWESPVAGRALGRLARQDADDRYIAAAAMSSVTRNLDHVIEAVVDDESGRHPDRPSESPPADLLAQLLAVATGSERHEAILKLLPAVARDVDGRYETWQLQSVVELLNMLDRRRGSLAQLQAESPPELAAAIGRLEPLFAFARRAALDGELDVTLRTAAVPILARGLSRQQDEIEALCDLLEPQQPTELQRAATATLARLQSDDVASRLLANWKNFGPALRGEVLDLLLRRPEWTAACLDAIESGTILPREIDATRRQQLTGRGPIDQRRRAAELLAGGASGDRHRVLAEYRDVLELSGDVARGGEVYSKRCAVCHRFRGQGTAVGPDLGALTDKSPEVLLEAILDPNRAVESRYVSYTALTREGLTYTGLIEEETANSITLLGQEGKQQVILRADLDVLESSGQSLMPEGLERDVDRQQLADLLAYLTFGGAAPKSFAGNLPELVVPEKLRGELACLASNAEIHGSTLVFEPVNGNLGFWGSEDDHAVWTIDVARPGRYAVIFDWACHDETAGNGWVLEVGPQRVTGTVVGTGQWENYRRDKVADVQLEPGRYRLGLRSNGRIRGYLIDLRSITLRPYGGP